MKTKEATYTVKRLEASNLADVARLHEAVYQRRPAADLFAKKYATQYTGVAYTGFLAYELSGIPIAFYGVIPCFLQHGSKQLLSAQSADTMTHPDYRGKGLFVELAERTYELCRENGIGLVFGFPNQNSLPGFLNKLDWQETERMDCFVVPVHKYNLERIFKKFPIIRQLYKRYINNTLKKHQTGQQGLCSSAIHNGFDGVDRTADYLLYKTYTNTTVVRIGKALVWLKVNNGLIIGDIELAAESFDSLMGKLLRLGRKLGVKDLLFHSSPGTRLHGLFDERYYALPSFPVIFKRTGSRIKTDRIKFTTADIDTF